MNLRRCFGIWLAAALVAFSVHGGIVRHYGAGARHRVLIVLDASYPMAKDWDRAAEAVRALARGEGNLYAVATDKGLVHGWAAAPSAAAVVPYAPRNLDGLSARLPKEAAEADRVVLVTNADRSEAAKSGISEVVTVR